MSQGLASLSNRAKWGLLALIFAFTQFIPLIINSGIVFAASPITLSKHQGQEMPSGDWGSGNRTEYKEGDTINFRFTANSSEAAVGDISIDFSNEPCHFFAETFSLGSVVPVSGASPTVTVLSLTSDGVNGDEFHQALKLNFSGEGEAVVYYTLTLSQSAGECTGSSQHSRLSPLSDTVQQTGRQNVPVPANQIIEIPDITIIKNIDTDGDGESDRTAGAGEWQFSLDGGNPVPTDANGKVIFTNVTPDGNHTIVESGGPTDQTFLSGTGTNCTFNGSTATASIAEGTTATDATCIFLNTVKKGSITIIKDANPASDQSFDFTASNNLPAQSFSLKDDGVTQDADRVIFGNLNPNQTYTFTETGETSWDLKSIVCTGDNKSVVDNTLPTASITLAAGENIVCTFSNDKQGTLIIEKQTIPDGSDASFTFIDSNLNSFDLSDDGQKTFPITAGQSFTVDESVKTGWELTNLQCNNDNVNVNLESGFVTFTPNPGEVAKCIFTNTKLGSIEIIKNAVPNSAQDFSFTANGNRVSNFSLDDDNDPTLPNSKTFTGLLPGTFSFEEASDDNWDLDSISCNAGSSTIKNDYRVVVRLSAGEDVTCTYKNKRHGQIIVQKTTKPSGDGQLFDITAGSSDGGLIFGDNTAKISDAQDAVFSIQQGKTYSVAETVPDGWQQTSNNCSNLSVNGNSPLVDGIPTVYCEIVNTKFATIAISKQTNPDGSQEVFDFAVSGQKTDQFQLSDGAAKTYLDLIPGQSITITETTTAKDGWNLSDIKCTGTVEKDILQAKVTFTPDPGQNLACTFFNDNAPVLTLIKKLNDNLYGSNAQVDDFTLYANNASDSSNDFYGNSGVNSLDEIGDTFQPGTYSLSESTSVWGASEFEQGDWICLLNDQEYDATSGEIALSFGDEATCTIENSMKPAKVIVYKKVVNDNGGELTAKDFSVRLSGEDSYANFEQYEGTDYPDYSGVVVFDELNTNEQFALSENPEHSDQYDITDISCESSFTVANGETVECFITNDDIPPKVIIKKYVNIETNQEFEFDLRSKCECSLELLNSGEPCDCQNAELVEIDPKWGAHQMFVTTNKLQAGEYTVEEDKVDGWMLTDAKCWEYGIRFDQERILLEENVSENNEDKDEVRLIVKPGGKYICKFVNEPLGDITITKYWDKNENGVRDDYFNQGLEPALEGIDFRLWSSPDKYEEGTTNSEGEVAFEDLPSRFYKVEELTPDGWRTTSNTCVGDDRILDIRELRREEIPADAIYLEWGESFECAIGNARNQYLYFIEKSNSSVQAQRVGDIVRYTITLDIPENSGVLHNPEVYDLPPDGFAYVPGTWSATSNLRGNLKQQLIVPTPNYASPGLWLFNGGLEGNDAFFPGETIMLSYDAKINEGVTRGTYPDLAYSVAMGGDESTVFANINTESDATDPFVGTEVAVITEDPEPETLLVNTGSPAIVAFVIGGLITALGLFTRLFPIYRKEAPNA